ncbi:hypothetical protein NC797_12855 [Aquibacillus sp. 3ASR75-11]|uniref:Uncharacterized protein n=1 Tax=Terrihalobacillus insolitus TaxID=2950438 RepID=A0A9X3WTF9_9BACI|nr:hypothetical protein [Terrihalobacillus insolitus]MDC3414184.1 hypothetical protein [Terrihalobacillus insolitus]MDC3425390.1 hypothetical protein [Terrihalobacillus insolitus]
MKKLIVSLTLGALILVGSLYVVNNNSNLSIEKEPSIFSSEFTIEKEPSIFSFELSIEKEPSIFSQKTFY